MTDGLTQRQRHQAEVQAYRVGRFDWPICLENSQQPKIPS